MVSSAASFGALLLVVALVVLAAVLSNRVSGWSRVPAPAFFLLAAALASDVFPRLGGLSAQAVQQVVTLALVVILFEGGMHMGWGRLRAAAGAVLWIGVGGTLVTAAAMAACAHLVFGFGWRGALLLGAALAPTDPAVVFSVLGRREITGRTGTILEGESGANDPVGIALMAALLAAGSGAGFGSAVASAAGTFAMQMLIGAVVGVAGGFGLLAFMRRVQLPSEGLYPLRTLAGAVGVYGLAAAAHGSGFLAVFVAGIILGDARAPFAREIRRFHAALAPLAEITAFTLLGLTVSLRAIYHDGSLLVGLALAAILAFLVRPLLVGLLLSPVRLERGERAFILWAGLKGAVPILLGTFVLGAAVPGAGRIYDVIVVVVTFSVIVQGGLVPAAANRFDVASRVVEPEPWSLGVRLRHEPEGVRRYTVAAGAPADGARIARLAAQQGVWVSVVLRDGRLLPAGGETVLRAGDEVLVLGDPADDLDHDPVFTAAARAPR